jgi:hypothetical protein
MVNLVECLNKEVASLHLNQNNFQPPLDKELAVAILKLTKRIYFYSIVGRTIPTG